MNVAVRWEGNALVISARVQPRASKDDLLVEDGRIRLRITAPPVDGAANAHIVRFLAELFGVPRMGIEIVRGQKGREKCIRITNPTEIPVPLRLLIAEKHEQKPLKK